ncbi:MAG TPA: hypothetical protein PKV98_10645 [Burkholderiaceae bacterium]|jgi:hypothetical protein|nr:hypothetical protein [Burkholderiaceae bacterium]
MGKETVDVSHLRLRGTAMRLTLSAGVANDLKALKRGLKDLAERLGHTACATGCNELHLNLERDFSVGIDHNAVALNPQPLPPLATVALPQDPVPIRVAAPAAVFDNINNLGTAIEKVLGRLGCAACCSGFDILFQRELDGFVVDAKLGLKGTGRFA